VIAEALKINRILTQIKLDGNQFGEGGATAIAEALKINRTLTHIDLSWNKFGKGAATVIAEALKTNDTLTELSLKDNDIGFLGATEIAAALYTNHTLTRMWLGGNSIYYDGVANLVKALEQNHALTDLELANHLELSNEEKDKAKPFLERNRKLKQQGCVALLGLRHRQRGLWGTLPNDVVQWILERAYPDILGKNKVKYPTRSAPTNTVEPPCDSSALSDSDVWGDDESRYSPRSI